jgi:hypothetical protein
MTPDPAEVWARRLDATSNVCGSAFRAVMPRMAPFLDATAFDRWAGRGLALAQTTWRGGECAAWYFRLSPQLLASLDLETLIWLAEPTLRAMEVSPQLGIELLRAAAHFAEGQHQLGLHDWLATGERLAPVGMSGRLAAAYFEVSPEVLALTGLREFQEWTALVQSLAATTEVLALEFVRQSPQCLENIPTSARFKALRLSHPVAGLAPTAIIDVLKTLSDALHVIGAALHDPLLDLSIRVAEAAPRHLEHVLKAVKRLMQGRPEAEREVMFRQCQRIALVDAEAGTLLCEHLPGVLGQLAATDVELWVARGLEILRDNRSGGLAYFARESQASQTELARLGRVAYLSSVQHMLRLYATALAGQALSIRSLAELPPALRSGLRQFPTMDGETVYLPERADRFVSREQNLQLLLVMTAHQAGYLEFATFSFKVGDLVSWLETTAVEPDVPGWRQSLASPSSLYSDFERFFAGFPRPSLARDIFYCLEDGRVDYNFSQA